MSTKLETLEIEIPSGLPRGLHVRKKLFFLCYSLVMILMLIGLLVFGIALYGVVNPEPALVPLEPKPITVDSQLHAIKTRPPNPKESTPPAWASTKCAAGFRPNYSGFCVESKFPFACSASEPCPADLMCHEGKCSCKYPEHQEYAPGHLRCESKVDGPCGQDSHCLKFSECRLFPNRPTGLCKCRQRTTINSARKCVPDYPIDCKSSKDCKPFANFECSKGICTCRDESTFSKEEQICVKLAGTPCRDPIKADVPCVINSKCRTRLDRACKSVGLDDCICKCKRGYRISSNFTCQKVS